MNGAPRCVCTHTEQDHRSITMSVPLRNPAPRTAVPIQPASIGYTYPDSTYERNECVECGCGEYLKDEEQP